MQKNLMIVGGVVVAVAAVVFLSNRGEVDDMMVTTSTSGDTAAEQMATDDMSVDGTSMEEGDMMEAEAMMEDGDMMMDDEAMMEDGAMMNEAGRFEDYSPEKLAYAEGGDVVLFFHASWCPSCRVLAADINKNLTAIPANTTILKVDYTTETELKQKYGVTYQHTLVQVDKDGNLIKKWSGSATLAALITQIQ